MGPYICVTIHLYGPIKLIIVATDVLVVATDDIAWAHCCWKSWNETLMWAHSGHIQYLLMTLDGPIGHILDHC